MGKSYGQLMRTGYKRRTLMSGYGNTMVSKGNKLNLDGVKPQTIDLGSPITSGSNNGPYLPSDTFVQTRDYKKM